MKPGPDIWNARASQRIRGCILTFFFFFRGWLVVCGRIQASRGAAQSRTEQWSVAWSASKSFSECGGGGRRRSVRRGSSRLTPVQPLADEAPPSLQDENAAASPQDPKNPPQSLGLGSAGLASAAQPRRFFETATRLKGEQS